MPDARKRAVIIGGSIAGLFAGLFLRRAGWEATIFERSPRGLEGRGAGIVTHDELHTALTACGIEDISSLGVTVPGRVVLARDGSVIEEYKLPQMLASWGVLHHALLSRFPEQDYRLGMALERYNQDNQSITAYFSNGSSETCDLLVGARRDPFCGAGAVPAGGEAGLCGLCRVARACAGVRSYRCHARRSHGSFRILPAGRRADARISRSRHERCDYPRPAPL